MAEVYDQWHLSRPKKGAEPCTDHSSKTRTLVPSKAHGKGKRWQVRWRDANDKQCKENFEKRSKADARASAVQADLDRGLYIDPSVGKESFRAVGERWRGSAVHRPSTASRVERAVRLHIYPTFGDRAIAGIRPSEVEAWVKDRAQVLAPNTLKSTYSYLVTVFRTAVHDGIIRANPCAGVKLPKVRRPEVVPLHEDAVRALIDAAPARYRALILLAAASGLRQGEVFGLEVADVNFLRREVTVRHQLVGPDEGEPFIGEPKTHESYRTVPLAKPAVDALAAHLAAYRPKGVVLEDRSNPRKVKERAAQLVFVNERGQAIRRSSWVRAWGRMEERANASLRASHERAHADWARRGRPDGQEPELVRVPDGASMHDLRHFYASLLIRNREDVKTVQMRLGHSKPSITLDIYTHLWPSSEDTTRAAVEAILGDVPALCPAAVAE